MIEVMKKEERSKGNTIKGGDILKDINYITLFI